MRTFVVLILLVVMFVVMFAFVPLAQRVDAQATAPVLAMHEVEGVRFAVPGNWTAIRNLPGDKMFRSPDRRIHLMALTDGWASYRNVRFGTVLSYSVEVFRSLGPPDNGDGRHCIDDISGASLYVFAQYNALKHDLA